MFKQMTASEKEAKKAFNKKRNELLLREIKRNKTLYFMVLPFLIFFIVFTIYPLLHSIWYSFTDYNILEKANFVGLRNYKELILNDQIFIKAIQNTFIIALCVGPGGYILAFLMAWLVNELPHWLGVFMTVIFYTPSLAGQTITIFRLIFANDSTGYLNGFLMKYNFNNSPIYWLMTPKYMMPLAIIVGLWMSLDLTFLTFIAALKGVDGNQYEAAAIDGVKNRWQELWYITLPNMKGALLFGSVLRISGALSFGGIGDALFGFPSPQYATHTIVNHLNDYGMTRLEIGKASAISVILSFIIVLCNFVFRRLLRKVGN